jgi:hypothetical protein
MRRIGWHQARTALAVGALCALSGVVALLVHLDRARADLYNPTYHQRTQILHARHAETPTAPLWLMVGSSRVSMAFAPEQLPTLGQPAPVVVNFGHYGAGPLLNLLQIQRLCSAGVRPQRVWLELMPEYMTHERADFLVSHAASRELPTLVPLLPTWPLLSNAVRSRIALGGKCLRSWGAWMTDTPTEAQLFLGSHGGDSCLPLDPPPAERARRSRAVLTACQPHLAKFAISPAARCATRQAQELCRTHGIALEFILMPEGAELRAAYPPAALTQLAAWSAELRAAGYSVTDARTWLADNDFVDQHHATVSGARAFTAHWAATVADQQNRE